jgi:hypothetical protein
MGLVQRYGKARLTIIGASSLKDIARTNVDNSALVITDSQLSYVGLGQEYAGHLSVNHAQNEYRNGKAYVNSVEGFI